MSIKISIISALALILAAFTLATSSVSAVAQTCFCHNVLHNPHTICTSNQGLISGHMAHVQSGFDSLGICPTPTPTGSPSGSPSPTPTPTGSPSSSPSPTPSPISCRNITQTSETNVVQTTYNSSQNDSGSGNSFILNIGKTLNIF